MHETLQGTLDHRSSITALHYIFPVEIAETLDGDSEIKLILQQGGTSSEISGSTVDGTSIAISILVTFIVTAAAVSFLATMIVLVLRKYYS